MTSHPQTTDDELALAEDLPQADASCSSTAACSRPR